MHLRLRRYDLWLDCRAETYPSPHPLWPSDPGSWPRLQRLRLMFDCDIADDPDSHPQGNLPNHFPGLATPILKRLSLTSCCMPDWNELWTIGNTLTHLEIYHPPSRLLEAFCNHPNTKERFTLGVKKFIFSDFFHCCSSFLDHIDLSATKCCSSNITCLSHPQFDLEIPAEDVLQAVLPYIKRLLLQVVINNSRFRISESLIMIQSGFTEPAILSRNLGQTVIAEHSNHFCVCFHRIHQLGIFGGPLLFATLLDLIRPICSSVELAEISSYAHLGSREWKHFFDILVHCQNLRFMQGVGLTWWKWLCKDLTPAIGEATNDATEPLFSHLRSISFKERVQIKERLVTPTNPHTLVDEIPFDELKVFCKHRAKIRLPLEWISTHRDGIFEMDSFGEIKPEPEPRNTTRRAGS
ncbi:hypothetical protein AGABI1DRAFT_131786 [Agaricus bisporus var. burnettii JB137-S8]|uniref:Uncharacterized protein n=1 Tax=Agaricus bisporus var. burnettii (strain JB137-S8 / ATCC MYA-4627 / FGSC 10392) TaxID=597362 RepID=K5VN44_AGABU|nr:uncharacterized protein AGABI1DRAFT_131786 [Agaricus bisporus var. burnettii JB137-S8]EKM75879.1 hypothetical protein AGABI1DRAFT_131786 [Agaricus bisporus var. burnettii JB137-S8]